MFIEDLELCGFVFDFCGEGVDLVGELVDFGCGFSDFIGGEVDSSIVASDFCLAINLISSVFHVRLLLLGNQVLT